MGIDIDLLIISVIQIIMISAMNAIFIPHLRNYRYMLIMIPMTVIYLISYYYISIFATGVVWLTLIVITRIISKRPLDSFISVTVSLLLYILSDYASSFLLELAFVNDNQIIRAIVSALVYLILGIVGKKMVNKIQIVERKHIHIVLLITLMTFFTFFITVSVERLSIEYDAMDSTNFFFILFYTVISTGTAFLIIKVFRERDKISRKDNEIYQLKKFSRLMENSLEDIRKIQHDYNNILLSMEGYLLEDDLVGLKKYYETIVKSSKSFDDWLIGFADLKNLEIPEIKGVLIEKMIAAMNSGTKVTLEVPDAISKINLPILDLVRVIGIFLDNAEEATSEMDEGFLRVAILNVPDTIYFICYNTINNDLPPLYKLVEKGFSTKGNNRGIGLSTVKEVISKYPHVYLDTKIEEDSFTQILKIQND